MTSPILSSTSVGYIVFGAVVITFMLSGTSSRTVDPTETAAIARTCEAKGMTARLEVGNGSIKVFCEPSR